MRPANKPDESESFIERVFELAMIADSLPLAGMRQTLSTSLARKLLCVYLESVLESGCVELQTREVFQLKIMECVVESVA